MTSYTYDTLGQLTSLTTPRGVATAEVGDFQTTYAYNDRGLLVGVTLPDPDGSVGPLASSSMSYSFDAVGRPVSQTALNSAVTDFVVDTWVACCR